MSTETVTRLWETDHPYQMSEGCYYARGNEQPHAEYDSWQEFLSEWGDAQEDYNHVFRWDWQTHECDSYCEDDCTEPKDQIEVFFIMQRKAFPFSTVTKVTREDEPAIREYLTARAEHVVKLWEPFLTKVTE